MRKRVIGFRPRIQALPSVAQVPNERWSTDMCRIGTGKDGWATLALIVAASALEHALIARFNALTVPFLLRSDNGLFFTSRGFTALVRGYGLCQEFIAPHCQMAWGSVSFAI